MKGISIVATALLFSCFVQAAAAEEAGQKERFQVVDESIVLDSQTGLMWAARDNGREIDWYEAESYCRDFEAGGFTDWRLPDIKELATLYTSGRQNSAGYFIAEPITITDCCLWSSDTNMGGAAIFSYKTGKEPAGFLGDTYQLRALPVRGTAKTEPGR